MEQYLGLIAMGASVLFAGLGIFFGVKWGIWKAKALGFAKVINYIAAAIEDNTITEDELKRIADAVKELVAEQAE